MKDQGQEENAGVSMSTLPGPWPTRRKCLLREELAPTRPTTTTMMTTGSSRNAAADSSATSTDGRDSRSSYADGEDSDEPFALTVIQEIQKLPSSGNMRIRQESGQRSYGPPVDWEGPPPPKGCEIFVGKLPRHIFEPQLIPLFEKMGSIYEFRMMIDFMGYNRGFCFVHYTQASAVDRAIRELDKYEILPGHRIGVVKSVNNARLFIGGIPQDKTEEEIHEEIDMITEGVTLVTLGPPLPPGPRKNRAYAYVEYKTHKAACMARRKMVSTSIKMWGQDVQVDWALDGAEVRTLHIQNINPKSTHESFKNIFNRVSNDGVEFVKILGRYAFIHLATREQAMMAKAALEGKELDGFPTKINWAKPANKYVASDPPALPAPRHHPRERKLRSPTPTTRATTPIPSPRFSRVNPPRSESPVVQHSPLQAPRYQHPHTPEMYREFPSMPAQSTSLYPSYPLTPMLPAPMCFPEYPSGPSPIKYDPLRELYELCLGQGWGEPVYVPLVVRFGSSLYYSCKVIVSHPAIGGHQEYQTRNYYHAGIISKSAAAEGMLRTLQGFLTRPVVVNLEQPYMMSAVPASAFMHQDYYRVGLR